MQLMPGESVVASFGNITLTTRRVQHERSEWGSKKVTTITLDHLTSCDIEARSKPIWIALGVVIAALALLFQTVVLGFIAILFFLIWFFSRRKAIVLRSASEKIEYIGSFVEWSALQAFLHKIQLAKADRESLAAGRQATAPNHEAVVKDLPQASAPAQTQESAVGGARPAFWTAASSTLHSSALISSAASATARIAPVTAKSSPIEQIPTPEAAPPETAAGKEEPVLEQSLRADLLPQGRARPNARIAAFCIAMVVVATLTTVAIFVFRLNRNSQNGLAVDSFSAQDREAVSSTIKRWSESFRTRDTVAHVACYAPLVDTYFKTHHVSREKLLRDKAKAFSAIATVRVYDVSDIQFSAEPNSRIAATFRKDWDYSTNLGSEFAGSEVAKLTFGNFSGEWKIVKEEELKIVRASRTADTLPTVVGQCTTTTVSKIGTRLTEGVNGPDVPGSGSLILYANGGSQVSYDTVPGIEHSGVGDKVFLCLVSIPTSCPPGDDRGKWYSGKNLRTGEAWRLPDSQHTCGGA